VKKIPKYINTYKITLFSGAERIQLVDGRKKKITATKAAIKIAELRLEIPIRNLTPNADIKATEKAITTIPYNSIPNNPDMYGKKSEAFDIPIITRKRRNQEDTESIAFDNSLRSLSGTRDLN
jgi:hypothetical protein